jgi:hypothetical protein
MATGAEVLSMLIPTGGWIITGNDFKDIQFIEAEPITKAKFESGFAQFDAWKAQQIAEKTATKQAILDKIGLTAEEAATLLS